MFALICFVAVFSMPVLFRPDDKTQPGKVKVGLCVMATGSYIQYVQRLLDSADQYFLPDHDITYFVFTDAPFEHPRAHVVYQSQMGWPYDSLRRFHTYLAHADRFAHLDYVYAIDADMGFVAPIQEEILSHRVATILSVHLFKPQKPYESNPISTAYVHRNEGKEYYAGAFYGGSRDEFITLLATISEWVDVDIARGYIAWANDESYLNRYFVSNQPTLELSPSYCHFEHWDSPFPKKILAYDDKNYTEVRKPSTISPIGWYKKMLKEVCT